MGGCLSGWNQPQPQRAVVGEVVPLVNIEALVMSHSLVNYPLQLVLGMNDDTEIALLGLKIYVAASIGLAASSALVYNLIFGAST